MASDAENVSIWWRHHGDAVTTQTDLVSFQGPTSLHILRLSSFNFPLDYFNEKDESEARLFLREYDNLGSINFDLIKNSLSSIKTF